MSVLSITLDLMSPQASWAMLKDRTLRVYLERHEPDASRQDIPAQEALQPLIALAEMVARIRHFTGMNQPTVTT